MTPYIPDISDKCARIGYVNSLVSSAQAPEALTPDTYSRYKPSTGAVVAKFQLVESMSVDYVAIGAHNIGSHDDGVEITVSYAATVGGALTEIDTITPTDNGAIMLTFTAVTAAEIAIETNATTAGLEIGVVYAGAALVMPVALYGGHSPIDLSGTTEYQSVMSDSGQFLGRSIIRKGAATSFAWQFLEPAWYRSTFQPFVESAKRLPFFIKWRPDMFETAALCYTDRDIKPVNMGGGSGLMSVDVSVRAHDDV